MQGGLLKSASAVALFAAAGLFGASPAKAADLGGDCCADLEERVAELEATTVRKGNRKVSITLSGFVSHQVMWWDDGTQSDTYIGDGGNYGSRFRFVGTAKVSPQVTAGFLYEWASNANAIGSTNQLNGGDDLGASGGANCQQQSGNASNTSGCIAMRQATAYLRHTQLGMVRIGHGSTATDDLTLIDVGGLAGAATSDAGLYMGGMILRSGTGLLGSATSVNWTAAIRGHESWDTSRRNNVLYETPTLAGFYLQAAVAEDNFWDVALRYAGEFGGFRIAAGIGYLEDTKFNAGSQLLVQNGALCATFCDTKVTDIKGSASIMHVPTGLFLTGAGGNREIDSKVPNNYAGPDLRFWWLAGGISQNFFGIGKTVLFGEYGEHKGGLAQANFLAGTTNYCTGAVGCDSKVTTWGVGVVQYIDAAAMEVFAAYKNYSFDGAGFQGLNAPLNANVHDMQAVIVGTRINF